MKTGRPVKYLYTREEEFHVSSTRVPWRIYFKDGVTKDGRIIARKVTSYADSGAYNRHTPYAVTKHAANIAGPYTIPNVYVDAYCVYTNRVPDERHARLRRHVGVLRHRGADGQDRAHGRAWTRSRSACSTRYRNGDMRPYQKVVGDATLVEVMQGRGRDGRASVGRAVTRPMNSWDRDYSPERLQPVRAGQGVSDMAKVQRHRHFVGQLPDRHEPGRRSDPGADPHDHDGQLRHQPGQRATWARA